MVDGVDPQTFDRIPTNLEVVGEQLGVQAVLRRELDVSAFLYPMEDNRLVVFLNSTDVPGRQRFSWAHELGHIVMAEESVPLLPCGTGRMRDKELERSCDVIAAELLMPRRLFAEAADMEGWTLKAVPRLARLFQVTMQAAAVRLCELSKRPLMMSVWQGNARPIEGLRYKWARPNQAGRTCRPKVEWKNNAEALAPLYQAFRSPGIAVGACKVLLTSDKLRNFRSVPSEAIGLGNGIKRTVIGFHYLGVDI